MCFLQDADALRANHDDQTFDDLSEAWRQMQIESPGMVGSNPAHMQIEFTEVSSREPPHAQRIDSPGASGMSDGGASRGVGQVSV